MQGGAFRIALNIGIRQTFSGYFQESKNEEKRWKDCRVRFLLELHKQ